MTFRHSFIEFSTHSEENDYNCKASKYNDICDQLILENIGDFIPGMDLLRNNYPAQERFASTEILISY